METITNGVGILTYFLPNSFEYKTIGCRIGIAGNADIVVDPLTGDPMDRFSISYDRVILWESAAASGLKVGGVIRETIAACLSGHEVTAEQREEITEKIESILFPYVVEVVGEVIEETLAPAEEEEGK